MTPLKVLIASVSVRIRALPVRADAECPHVAKTPAPTPFRPEPVGAAGLDGREPREWTARCEVVESPPRRAGHQLYPRLFGPLCDDRHRDNDRERQACDDRGSHRSFLPLRGMRSRNGNRLTAACSMPLRDWVCGRALASRATARHAVALWPSAGNSAGNDPPDRGDGGTAAPGCRSARRRSPASRRHLRASRPRFRRSVPGALAGERQSDRLT